jgi:voltage-gated potassium channel
MKIEGGEEHLDYIDVLITVLSIYLLGAIVVETFFTLPPEVSKLLHYIDNAVCVIFFLEFWYQFFYTRDKLKFLKWGWIDLLSSIPMVDSLRYGRMVRLIRLIRVFKAFKSINHFLSHIFENKVKGLFISVGIFATLLLIFSSIAILMVETDPNSNIKTAEDAIWWAYVTITTVGYGDKYPVTTEGRILAGILMTVGVGLFGTLTAFMSSLFLKGHTLKNDNN